MSIGDEVINKINNTSDYGEFGTLVEGSRAFAADTYNTLMIIAIYGGIIMMLAGFIIYMFSTGKSKENAKTKIMLIVLGIILSFMTLGFVAIIISIAQ